MSTKPGFIIIAVYLAVALFFAYQSYSNPYFPGNFDSRATTAKPPAIFPNDRARDALNSSPHSRDSFCFAHISDVHIGSTKANISDIKYAIDSINLIHPAFVLSTGDFTDHGYWEEYDEYVKIISLFEVPVFTIQGNHERLSDPFLLSYHRFFGPANNYSFYFGNNQFVALDTAVPRRGSGFVKDGALRWLRGELNGSALTKTVFTHHGIFGDINTSTPFLFVFKGLPDIREGRDDLLRIMLESNVTMMLSGHEHANYEKKYENTTFLVTTTFGEGPFEPNIFYGPKKIWNQYEEVYPGYRLVCINQSNIAFNEVAKMRDINYTTAFSGNRTVLKIKNEFKNDYPYAILKMNVPDCSSGYRLRSPNAEVIGSDGCAVLVRTNLTAGEEKTVALEKTA